MSATTFPMTTNTEITLNPTLVRVRLTTTQAPAAPRLSPLAEESLQALRRPYEPLEWLFYGSLMLTTSTALILGFFF
jgi:hypothetical protein